MSTPLQQQDRCDVCDKEIPKDTGTTVDIGGYLKMRFCHEHAEPYRQMRDEYFKNDNPFTTPTA